MKAETKHLDKSEGIYDMEYVLRQEIHFRIGEMIKVEYINAKHCREIEGLNIIIGEKDKSIGKREKLIDECLRSVDRHLQDKARMAQIIKDFESSDQHSDLFEYIKALLIELSNKEGNEHINPDNINVKYIEAASRYCFPVLFDKYACLDQDDTNKLKIQFAEHILQQFDLKNMHEYENLHADGEVDIEFIDNRYVTPYQDEKKKIELADRILHKFGIDNMGQYEDFVMCGDIEVLTVDRRFGRDEEHIERRIRMVPAKIGDEIYVPNEGWSGKIVGITDLLGSKGGRMLTVHGPGKKLALVNE